MANDAPANRAANQARLQEAQARIGHTFKQAVLLKRALTHSSSTTQDGVDNSTFSFLGDSVLCLAIDSVLLVEHPGYASDELSKRRNTAMPRVLDAAKELGLLSYAKLGLSLVNERNMPSSVLVGLYQAICGAIFLDNGFDAARTFVKRTLKLSELVEPASNPKTEIQIWAQGHFGVTPVYKVLNKSGPEHQVKFEVGIYIKEKAYGKGSGLSKQQAETIAAAMALKQVAGTAKVLTQPLAKQPLPLPSLEKLTSNLTPSKHLRKPSRDPRFGYCEICHRYVEDFDSHRTSYHQNVSPASIDQDWDDPLRY